MNKLAGNAESGGNTLWTDEELRHAVDVYLLLLRMQAQGIGQRAEPVAQAVLNGLLTRRNSASIRYRMRNISAVAKEIGVPTLKDFSPAESVGSNVRPRIRALLLEHADMDRILNANLGTPSLERQEALLALEVLRERIRDIEEEFAWIGHNNPPHEADLVGLGREHIHQARTCIDAIRLELEKSKPDQSIVGLNNSQLVVFANRLAKWIGKRATKFVDAALIATAPLALAKVTGLLPILTNAVEAVARTLGH